MLSHSHGRALLALTLAFLLCFLLLRWENGVGTGSTLSIFRGKSSPNSIANKTLGFEKIFVVNAPWRTDRRDAMTLAASYSNLKLDWVDGVAAETIHEKAYPPGDHRLMSPGNLGSWRAHMDAMREVISRNLSTALIFEDDVDWDIRIRSQLLAFSTAARKLLLLTPDLDNGPQDHPPSSETQTLDLIELAKRSSLVLPTIYSHGIRLDPYGRDWDVLWLGHCGADLPPPSPTHQNRLIRLKDATVPLPKHLRLREPSSLDPIATLYPPHTRVYHRTSNTTLCTLAYAVTQRGARKILYELGIRDLSKGYDFALSDHCGGLVKSDEEGVGRRLDCVTVQPPLFSHFWGERGGSDIQGLGGGGRPEVGSRYVMRSVRGNLQGLGEGRPVLFEQWGE